jgi:hypothetical protein
MNRKRLARFVLLIALLVVGGQVLQWVPRAVDIRYHLGPRHRDFTEARIAYMQQGHEIKGVRLRYESGAPESIRHQVDLSPGRYEIAVELRGPDAERTVRRALQVPADGVVRVDLFDRAMARMGRGGPVPSSSPAAGRTVP